MSTKQGGKKVEADIKEELKQILAGEIDEVVRNQFINIVNNTYFGKDKEILELLDQFFFLQEKSIPVLDVFSILRTVFCVNKYFDNNDRSFFDGLAATKEYLRTHQAEAWQAFFDSFVIRGKGAFYYSINIYEKILDDTFAVAAIQKVSNNFPWILMIRSLLYYTFIPKRTVQMMFQVVPFILAHDEMIYREFCLKEVFKSLRYTCFTVSHNYMESEVKGQKALGVAIQNEWDKFQLLQKQSKQIPDLQESEQRRFLFFQAYQLREKRMKEEAESQSVFASLFSRSYIKYGNGVGRFFDTNDGNYGYEFHPGVALRHEVELPEKAITDPLAWCIEKVRTFEMREKYLEAYYQRTYS